LWTYRYFRGRYKTFENFKKEHTNFLLWGVLMAHKSKLKVTSQNQAIIDEYLVDLKIVRPTTRPNTLKNNRTLLRTLGDFLGEKSFKECNEQEMKRFFETTTYHGDSLETLKVAIRKFYCWLYKTDDYPVMVKWIHVKTLKEKEKLREKDIDYLKKKVVSIEEYQKMISHLSNDIQMQAVLETLYWSGCRPGEVLSVNIGGVEITDDCVIITVRDSKTQKRKVPIIPFPELLIRWIDNHPMKNNSDTPLFISFNRDRRVFQKRLTIHYLERVFRNTTKDLGMKRITPHYFRHTTITRDLANGMPHTHLTTKCGLTKDSAMLRIYDHNDFDELVKHITGKPLNNPEPSIDILKQQKQRIEKEMNEKQQLKERLETLENNMKALNSNFGKMMVKSTRGYDGDEMVEFHGYDVEEVIRKYNHFKENVSTILSYAVSKGVPDEEIRKYKAFMDKLMA
jgi:integrase